MSNPNFALLVSAALLALAASRPASAAVGFGSAALDTYRNCATTATTAPCDGATPNQQIISQSITGGVSATANTALSLPDGSFANSQVSFGGLDLPVIRGETSALGNERMNVNAFGYQTYTYTGAAGTPFSITGALHIVDSSANGVADGVDPSNPSLPLLGGTFPGGAIGTAYVGIWDTSIVSSFTDVNSIFSALFLALCDAANPHVLGSGTLSQTLTGGDQTLSVSTTSCSGSPLLLTPGEEVLVVAGLQLPVNRGGFADATHTFTTELDPNLPAQARAALTAGLVSARSVLGVPEPSSWALMLVGFLSLGGALRGRRAAGLSVHS